MPNSTSSNKSIKSDLPTVTIYWLEQSRSQRILWLLEALNAPYDIQIYHRDKRSKLAPAALKKVHALGKSPVISLVPEGGSEPIYIAESGAITEYLVDHYGKDGKLVPARWREGQEGKVGGETEEWMRFKYYLHYGEGSLMGFLMAGLIASRIRSSPVPFFIKPITNRVADSIIDSYVRPNYETHFNFLESQLETSPNGGGYLCGADITASDILMSFPLIAAKMRSGSMGKDKYPLLNAYVERLERDENYIKSCVRIQAMEGKFEPMM